MTTATPAVEPAAGSGSGDPTTRPDRRHLVRGAVVAFVLAFAVYVGIEVTTPPPAERYINPTPLMILLFAGLPLGLGSALLRAASIGWLAATAGFAVAGVVVYGMSPELAHRVGEAPSDLIERVRLGLVCRVAMVVSVPLYLLGAAIGLLARAMNRRDAAAHQ